MRHCGGSGVRPLPRVHGRLPGRGCRAVRCPLPRGGRGRVHYGRDPLGDRASVRGPAAAAVLGLQVSPDRGLRRVGRIEPGGPGPACTSGAALADGGTAKRSVPRHPKAAILQAASVRRAGSGDRQDPPRMAGVQPSRRTGAVHLDGPTATGNRYRAALRSGPCFPDTALT